jgi:NADPH:quinone reductase and related Zn-dependent oxidoreductases
VVEAVGENVTLFKPGDEVYYAGDVTRSGTNAQFHLVDERLVMRKPATLAFALAIGPMCSVTMRWFATTPRALAGDAVAGSAPQG